MQSSNPLLERVTHPKNMTWTLDKWFGAYNEEYKRFNGTTWERFTSHLSMQHVVLGMAGLLIFVLVMLVLLTVRLRGIYLRYKYNNQQPPTIAVVDSQTVIIANIPDRTQGHNAPKRNLFSRMIARIEELDSLTPLIVTPGSLAEETDNSYRERMSRVSAANQTLSSKSPPPPRKGTLGKVTLVPLGNNLQASRNRMLAANSPLIEQGVDYTISITTRSIGTIPEMETERNEAAQRAMAMSLSGESWVKANDDAFKDFDLVSIDRTSISTLEKAPDVERCGRRGLPMPFIISNNNAHRRNSSNGSSSLQPPSYPPPSIPSIPSVSSASSEDHRNDNLGLMDKDRNYVGAAYSKGYRPFNNGKDHVFLNITKPNIARESSSGDSLCSQLSSPLESSVGDSGSPLDTTGSINDLSDSYYLASESDQSEAKNTTNQYRAYIFDSASSTSVSGRLSGSLNSFSGTNNNLSDEKSGCSTVDLDTAPGRRYHLHRIEEESEIDDLPFCGRSRTEESLSALSQDRGSILDSECNLLLPLMQPQQNEGLI